MVASTLNFLAEPKSEPLLEPIIDPSQQAISLALLHQADTPKPATFWMFRAQLLLIWVVLIVGMYLLFTSAGYLRAVAAVEASQTRSLTNLTAAAANEQGSIGGLTAQVEAESRRVQDWTATQTDHVNTLDGKVTRNERELRRLAARMDELEGSRRTSLSYLPPATPPAAAEEASLASVPVLGGLLPSQSGALIRGAASPDHLHVHTMNSSIPLVAGANMHTNHMNEKDYWFMQRTANGKAYRVIPFGVSNQGVQVHCIDDGLDYTLTKSGKWISSN
jgi:hypothetical protein